MFTTADRDATWHWLLALARADDDVPAAATTGSGAADESDAWSDVDLAVAVNGDVAAVMSRWTARLEQDFGAVHHWDLPSGPSVYRVFLLPAGLEVDIAFTPAEHFGPLGPQWRLEFGSAPAFVPVPPTHGAERCETQPSPAQHRPAQHRPAQHSPARPIPAQHGPTQHSPEVDNRIGRGWHHVLHARACIERGRLWQAEWLIAALREHLLALACLRLGLPVHHARGADELPPDITGPVRATLVATLDGPELRRALTAAADALTIEVAQTAPELAQRLRPILAEFATMPLGPPPAR